MTKTTLKRYAVSSALTFLTCFSLVILVDIDNITMDSFKDGSFAGLLFVAVRAGIKGLLELFVSSQK